MTQYTGQPDPREPSRWAATMSICKKPKDPETLKAMMRVAIAAHRQLKNGKL